MEGQPKYRWLASVLRQAIEEGEYAQGEQLQTEHELAGRYDLSRQTVRQALDVLAGEGLIDRRRGSGTFVAGVSRGGKRPPRVQVIAQDVAEGLFPAILRGIEAELAAEGTVMQLSATHRRADGERRILSDCLRDLPDGLLVEGTKTALPNPNLALYTELFARGIPVVFVGGHYRALAGSVYVAMDDRQGGADAARLLIGKGHTRIGGVFPRDDAQAHLRCMGYLETLVEAGLTPDDDAVVWLDAQAPALGFGTGIADRVADALADCSAAICHEDVIALWLCEVLRRAGRDLTGAMALVSFGGDGALACLDGRVQSFLHPKETMGRLAARKLMRRMNGGDERPEVLPWVAPRG